MDILNKFISQCVENIFPGILIVNITKYVKSLIKNSSTLNIYTIGLQSTANVIISSEFIAFNSYLRHNYSNNMKVNTKMRKFLKPITKKENEFNNSNFPFWKTYFELMFSPLNFEFTDKELILIRGMELNETCSDLELNNISSYLHCVELSNIKSINSFIGGKYNCLLIIKVEKNNLLLNPGSLGAEYESGEIIINKGGNFHKKHIEITQYKGKPLRLIFLEYSPTYFAKPFVVPYLFTKYTDISYGNVSKNEFAKTWEMDVSHMEYVHSLKKYSHCLVTYNVHGWKDIHNNDRTNEILDLLCKSCPDFICLQEDVDNKKVDDFLNDKYNKYNTYSNITIWSKNKYTLLDSEKTNNYMILKFEKLAIFNVYLSNEETLALKEISIINSKIREFKGKIVVCGDFKHLDRFNYTDYNMFIYNNNNIQNKILAENQIVSALPLSELERKIILLRQYTYDDIPNPCYTTWTSRGTDYIFSNMEGCKYTYPIAYSNHLPVFFDFRL